MMTAHVVNDRVHAGTEMLGRHVANTYQNLFQDPTLGSPDIDGDLVSLNLEQHVICLNALPWLLQDASNGPLCMQTNLVFAG